MNTIQHLLFPDLLGLKPYECLFATPFLFDFVFSGTMKYIDACCLYLRWGQHEFYARRLNYYICDFSITKKKENSNKKQVVLKSKILFFSPYFIFFWGFSQLKAPGVNLAGRVLSEKESLLGPHSLHWYFSVTRTKKPKNSFWGSPLSSFIGFYNRFKLWI